MSGGEPRDRDNRVVATAMVLTAIGSVQFGSALATTLFDHAGAGGTTFLRTLFAAILLMAIWRPALRLARGAAGREVLLFGLVLALMNLFFYLSLDRIPLGIAVTLEFTGPLAVATLRSRHRRDLIWVALAAGGLLLLTPTPNSGLDPLGCAFALLAGCMWGTYIVVGARIGRTFEGGDGLALAMCVSAVILLPAMLIDITSGEIHGLSAGVLAAGLGVAVLSSALPYSLEIESLRRLPEAVFGVLMSLEPAVAAVVGFLVLDQGLEAREVLAIALVLAASAGALSRPGVEPPVEA